MERDLTSLFGGPSQTIPLDGLILNLLLAALLAYCLGWVYKRFGQSLSNRALFARNFVLLTVTTTLIITIVKSSLALSLGLVGALSIVRFRSAIKEPEELAYLFLAISIGLGMGANQAVATAVAFGIIMGIIILRRVINKKPDRPNLYLTISSPGPQKLGARQILDLLTQAGAEATLKRFDETPEQTEAAFQVSFKSIPTLEQFNHRMRELDGQVRISYMEERGIGV